MISLCAVIEKMLLKTQSKLEQEMTPLTKEDLKEEYDKAFGSKMQMF